MCCHEDFCNSYQSDFIVGLAMLNIPLIEKYQLRNKLISNKADAAVWCTEDLMRISKAVFFIQYVGRKKTFHLDAQII